MNLQKVWSYACREREYLPRDTRLFFSHQFIYSWMLHMTKPSEPMFPHLLLNRCHPYILSNFPVLSNLVWSFIHLSTPISTSLILCMCYFLIAQHSTSYSIAGLSASPSYKILPSIWSEFTFEQHPTDAPYCLLASFVL